MEVLPNKFKHYFSTSLVSSLVVLSLYPNLSHGYRIHNFETTRLKSTAGAGVGSVLMEEATLLNPAPLAFFDISSFYLQKADMTISQQQSPLSGQPESDLLGVIASDGNQTLSGSVSYAKQQEGFNSRKQFAGSTATNLGEKSAAGITYKIIKDQYSEDGYNYEDSKYKQFSLGFSHVLNPNVMFGLVFVDPLKEREEETRAIVGFQYVYQQFISLMADLGSDYNQDLSTALLYKVALQLNVFSDFYLRFGTFNDKGHQEKGNGAGIAWVQPKLSFELAFKNSKLAESEILAQKSQNIKETSFSLSYRF